MNSNPQPTSNLRVREQRSNATSLRPRGALCTSGAPTTALPGQPSTHRIQIGYWCVWIAELVLRLNTCPKQPSDNSVFLSDTAIAFADVLFVLVLLEAAAG